MEPIPETTRAVTDFGPFAMEDEDLLIELVQKGQWVVEVVPQCLGVSLTSNLDQVTFTLVATAQQIAILDAIQYVAGGPCVTAVEAEQVVAFTQEDLFDEQRWRLFARAGAAASVRSTLTLPILDDAASVIGSVNLYASTPGAFDGHHEEMARIFDAWAPGAVTNADLSFRTRAIAEGAPERLREDVDVAVARNLIAEADHVTLDAAEQRLHDAAQRAGISIAQLARTIVELRLNGLE